MDGPKISVIGHAGIDYIIDVNNFGDINTSTHINNIKQYYGGTGMNTAFVAAKMGANVKFLTCTGDDFHPDDDFSKHIILRKFKAAELEDPKTPTCYIINNKNGYQKAYIFDNTLQHYDKIKHANMHLDNEECVHMTTTPIDFSIRNAQDVQEQSDAVVSWGPGQNLKLWDRESFSNMIQNVNILFINSTEMKYINNELGYGANTLIDMMNDSHDKILIMTMGGDGSMMLHNRYKNPWYCSCVSANCVDPTGCGDAFAGAFLTQILDHRMSLPDAMLFASTVAAFVIEKRGCQTNIPSYSDVLGRMQLHHKNR
ncbi:MAG: hypothetical protein IKT40_02085 [Bacilli bacterium]|nr:hypothetical protein [Bacilli bacterium]